MPSLPPTPTPFITYADDRLRAMRDGRRLTLRGTHFSQGSAGGYATLLKYVRHYAELTGPLDTAELDEAWLAGFLRYLLTTDPRHNSIHSALRKARALAREQCRLERRWCPRWESAS